MHDLVYSYPEGHAAHFQPGHPERPERVEAVVQGLEMAGFWQPFLHLQPLPLSERLLERVHSASYLERLEVACRHSARLDADTYTTPHTWQLALNAAGGAAAVAGAVWQGEARRGFALSRPPGHHATMLRGMGFCLLNNIALASDYLLTASFDGGKNPTRLAIVDLDLHHGNGTQDIFWQRDDVLFISTHQSPLFPGTGALQEIGSGVGRGYTANFPLPPYTGDGGFCAVMDDLILPLLDRHAPEMLLVSYGFDPHWRDPLGSLNLSAACLGALIGRLAGWADNNCGGKIALFLEGGYDLEAGKVCSQAVTAALLDLDWRDPLGPAPQSETADWRSMVRAARSLWQV